MENIILVGKYDDEKMNPTEDIRKVYKFQVGDQVAYMMAVIENGDYRIYNMDGDRYYSESAEEEVIPSDVLQALVDLSFNEIEADFVLINC